VRLLLEGGAYNFNLVTVTVTRKRKGKVGLVIVYSLHTRTEECKDFEERTE